MVVQVPKYNIEGFLPIGDKYKVTVEFVVPAEYPEEAEDEIIEFIQQAILHYADMGDRDLIYEFDVIDTEPAEIC